MFLPPPREAHEANIRSVEARTEAALAVEDPSLGASYSHWMSHWSAPRSDGDAPCFTELVVSFRGGERARLGFMAGGRLGATLTETVASMLRSTLAAHLEAGGDRERAAVLADAFRIAFPDFGILNDMSPMAQAFLVAVVPSSETHDLKAYFNTRLCGGEGHEARALDIAALAKVDRDALREVYCRLYGGADSTRFYGVGLDLGAQGERRSKFYLRLPHEKLADLVARLASWDRNLGAAGTELVAKCERLSGTGLASECEIGVAVVGEALSLKLTLFWPGKAIDRTVEGEVLAFLDDSGLGRDSLESLERLLPALRAPKEPTFQRSPLHGIGFEIPADDKLNLYLQAEL